MLREKLLSGKLRKHSEQLNKFVAGFFDTDGCVGITLDKQWLKVYCKITQAASKDPDFEVMRALCSHYKLGYIVYTIPSNPNCASCSDWILNISDSHKFFNLIGKHLLVKYKYFEECLWIYNELKGIKITKEAYQEIREYLDCFKSKSLFPRIPKHLSWSYAAGVLCGDGHFRCKNTKRQKVLEVELYNNSEQLVQSFCSSFRGTMLVKSDNCYKWRRSLGKNSRIFSIRFLDRLKGFMLLKTKRDVVFRMLEFHKLPAETKQGAGQSYDQK